MSSTLLAAILVFVGAVSGVLGTIAGLGGGFVVIPVLRLGFGMAPATTAGVSLCIVLANAVSGSFAYLRQGRSDVRSAVLVALGGIPASIAGAILVQHVSFRDFDLLYAGLLLFFCVYIVRRRHAQPDEVTRHLPRLRERKLVDADGTEFRYFTSTPLVLASGVLVGFISSFFGVGGGIIFVPVFIGVFRMPPHVVTATSTLAILLTSPVGLITHLAAHDVDWLFALPLAAGGLIGGQIGPRIAKRLSSPQLVTALALLLFLTAISLVAQHVVR